MLATNLDQFNFFTDGKVSRFSMNQYIPPQLKHAAGKFAKNNNESIYSLTAVTYYFNKSLGRQFIPRMLISTAGSRDGMC